MHGKVLIVDDDLDTRESTAAVLALGGYDSVVVSSGAEALYTLARDWGRIGLIVLDLVMPGMTGEQVAEVLDGGKPIVVMTGMPDAGKLPSTVARLLKPADVDELLAVVHAFIEPRLTGVDVN